MTIDPASVGLLTPQEFEKHVESYVYDSDDSLSYVEAVVAVCEDLDLEVEAVPGILTATLKAKLESNFMDLNLLPKKARLPEDW